MLIKSKLKGTCNLFNQGLLKIQDVVEFGLNGYALSCNDGKVVNIAKEEVKKQ